MKKRLYAMILCIILAVSVFSVNAFAAVPACAESSKTAAAKSVNAFAAVSAYAAGSKTVKKVTPTVTLSKTSYIWNGKAKKPAVTVKVGSKKLTKGRDYKVSYSNNINVGKASVKVTLKGKYRGSKTKTFSIRSKGTALTGLKKDGTCLTVRWKKQSTKMSSSRITGYQLQIARDPEFRWDKRIYTVKGYKTTAETIGDLESLTRYYVRVRTYKTVGGKNYYSSWSEARSAKDFQKQGGSNLISNPNDEKLADALYLEQGGNTIISPMSIHMALAMLLEGAKGDAKEELEAFLGVKQEALAGYVETILKSVAEEKDFEENDALDFEMEQKPRVTLISNAFWHKPDQLVEQTYADTLKDRYNAEVSALDFSDTEEAARIINDWCSEKTKGLIPSIVQPENLQDITDVLLNTLYFKSAWVEPVDEGAVRKGDFTRFDGSTYEVEYLRSEEHTVYENDQAIAFAKPYVGNCSFIGILPKQEGEFTLEGLDIPDLLNSRILGYDEVIAVMPKFNIESGGDITDIIQALGVSQSFTPFADFTGIAPDLYVSFIIHKTKMILNEKGTEAAAATAIGAKETGLPIEKETITIELNRPYAFIIMDNTTGNILFMGKVTEPT